MTQEHCHVNTNKQQDRKNNAELFFILSWTEIEIFEQNLEMC